MPNLERFRCHFAPCLTREFYAVVENWKTMATISSFPSLPLLNFQGRKYFEMYDQSWLVLPSCHCRMSQIGHANGAKGQSVTNAEVEKDNTVVLIIRMVLPASTPILVKATPAKDSDMKTLTLCLALSCLLTGCISQRYVGVQFTFTAPMNVTHVLMGGGRWRIRFITKKMFGLNFLKFEFKNAACKQAALGNHINPFLKSAFSFHPL
jgi:hypothetical protein